MQQKRVVLCLFFMAKHSFIKTVVKVFFIRTSADKRVGAVIYNSFLSLVIARLIENNDACIIKSTIRNLSKTILKRGQCGYIARVPVLFVFATYYQIYYFVYVEKREVV